MIKIIHLITGLGQGGAEQMLYNLVAHIDKTKFDNYVISMTDEGVFGEKFKVLGVPIYCLRMRPGKLSLNFRQYRHLIKSIQPHIVQAWMYHANCYAIIAKPFLPVHRVIFNIRTTLDGLQKAKKITLAIVRLNACFSQFVTKVIYNSHISQTQHKRIGFTDKNTIYIGNGFDVATLRPCSSRYAEFRKTHRFADDTKIVAMFARFHPIKNHQGFLEMAGMLKESFSEKVVFLMAGTHVDYNNTELLATIERLKLTNQVLLLGNVNVREYLPVTDVVVLPSLGEGFPNIIGEAMACGVPCVATDVGETRQILADCGYAVPVNNISALVEKVSEFLLLASHAYDALSLSCVERIQKNYNIIAIANQYEKLYTQVVQ